MKDLFIKLKDTINSNKDCILCTIINSSGSAPRGAGAKMLVFDDSSIYGTIGGGKVEYKAIELSLEILKSKKNKIVEYNLNKDDVLDLGMVCGGQVNVYFKFFDHNSIEDKESVEYICTLFDKDEVVWLITEVDNKDKGQIFTYCESDGIKSSTLSFDDIKDYLSGKAILIKDKFLIEPLFRSGYTYIFGGGHISQALVPVLSKLGFNPVVLEDREKFTDKSLFPGVIDTKLIDFKNPDIKIKNQDNIVIMTRGHEADFEVLSFALKSNCSYLGLIGSKSKWQFTCEKLDKLGFSSEDYKRVHNPIGLDILAETPDEIAISIAAEMIKYRAENT